jgi:CheY-like chemotaxis protein
MRKSSVFPKKKSILIVEDENEIRGIIHDQLMDQGYEIFTAANGRQGFELLARNPKIDLILLDLMMPVMNGWQFISAIAKNKLLRGIPIVVVSAFSDQAKVLGVRDVIQKPFEMSTMLETVELYCS